MQWKNPFSNFTECYESAGVVPALHEALNQGFEVHYDAFRVACSGCRGVWNQVGIAVLM